jgi:hypothetical protein
LQVAALTRRSELLGVQQTLPARRPPTASPGDQLGFALVQIRVAVPGIGQPAEERDAIVLAHCARRSYAARQSERLGHYCEREYAARLRPPGVVSRWLAGTGADEPDDATVDLLRLLQVQPMPGALDDVHLGVSREKSER